MTDKKKKRIRIILFAAAVLAGGLMYTVFGCRGQETLYVERTAGSAETAAEEPAESADAPNNEESPAPDIFVHVCGAVREPDRVYRLPAGARVEDAVNAAGGACPDAALWRLNLAAYLSDGQRIYVPAEGEEADAQDSFFPQAVTEESSGSHLTDLNKASKIELEELPGIGPALADRIVAYREEHGGFSDVEELVNVSGIGEVLMTRLRSLVTADGP